MPQTLTLGKWEKLLLFLSWSICVWSGEGKLPVLSLWGILSLSQTRLAVNFGLSVLSAAGTNPSPVAVPSIPALKLLLGPGLQLCPCSCRGGQQELCSSVPVTHRPLASQEAAAARLVCVGSRAVPCHILQQLSSVPGWSRSPGWGWMWASNPLGASQGTCSQLVTRPVAHWGGHNHQGVLVWVLFVPGGFFGRDLSSLGLHTSQVCRHHSCQAEGWRRALLDAPCCAGMEWGISPVPTAPCSSHHGEMGSAKPNLRGLQALALEEALPHV